MFQNLLSIDGKKNKKNALQIQKVYLLSTPPELLKVRQRNVSKFTLDGKKIKMLYRFQKVYLFYIQNQFDKC